MNIPAQPMYGDARPLIPHGRNLIRHRFPHNHNHQWRPYAPHGAFRPRNQGFYNNGPPAIHGAENHWCETCDRGFPTENLLEKHKQQHQKCNIDGCQFIAHPKVITKHIQMQHSSGIYKKIAKLNNPEEIEKWKEERRKKYPTKTNIEKKAAELKEKIDRGEKMGLGRKEQQNRRDGNNQYMNSRGGQGMKRGYNNNQPESTFRKPRRQAPKRPKMLPEPEENRSIQPFAGIQCLAMDSDEEADDNLSSNNMIEDDEIAAVNDFCLMECEKAMKPVVCGALSSLMCEYGSSDEEVDDIHTKQSDSNINKTRNVETNAKPYKYEEPQKIGKIDTKCPNQQSHTNSYLNVDNKITTTGNNNGEQKEISVKTENSNAINRIDSKFIKPINKNNDPATNEINTSKIDDDDSGPEEVKVVKNNEEANSSINDKDDGKKILKKKLEVAKKKPVFRKPKPRIPSTLIYRLLSKEMKQERNIVLQCIRYVRKNNYFDR